MRKYYICLILIILGFSLYAQGENSKQLRFGLISSPVYNLDLRLSNSLHKVYVTAEFNVKPDSTMAVDYFSFFLNRDANIEQMYVNSERVSPSITTNLQVEHFVPTLPIPALLDSNTVEVCYSLKRSLFVAPDSVSVKLKYWLPLPEWQPFADGSEIVGFLSEYYWFPRNIESESTIYLKLLSAMRYTLKLDEPCCCDETDGLRIQRGCFKDAPGKSSFMKIIRS
ncbi:hypothetical protein MASR2M64_01580 [Candidatus Cloacimonadota bacterium]